MPPQKCFVTPTGPMLHRPPRGHGAQLAVLLRQDLAAVEDAREEHRQLARQAPVELLPQLEAGAARERVEEHPRRLLRPFPQGPLIHLWYPPTAPAVRAPAQ